MAHTDKTYVVFDGTEDIRYYNLMKAWRENKHIDFHFYDAHDLDPILWAQNEQYIKSKLRERMNIAKQVLVLIGQKTKYHTKYIQWEIDLAEEKGIPIIVVNLDGYNGCNSSLCHPSLKITDSIMHVPFGPYEIKFALDNFHSKPNNPSKNGHSWYYSQYD